MHVPDGFLDAPTSVATAGASAAVVAVALRQARTELDDRAAPLAGLVAVYVFAVQMLNFPVGIGTSGHLMGGALAAVLVGPWTAVLCLTVVLALQSLFFADGGLTALGTNVLLLGVVTVLVGYVGTRAALAVLPRRTASVVPAAFVGALLSVPAAALAFVALYLVGGAAPVPVGPLVATMLGWHLVIGVGEAVITALTVSAVLAGRPDLVHAARGLRPALLLRTADGTLVPAAAPDADPVAPRASLRPFVALAASLVVLLAGGVSFFAAAAPDGLERVAEDTGFLATAREHALAGWALADYGEAGGIPVGVAGLVGVALTALVSVALFRALARRRPGRPAAVDLVDVGARHERVGA